MQVTLYTDIAENLMQELTKSDSFLLIKRIDNSLLELSKTRDDLFVNVRYNNKEAQFEMTDDYVQTMQNFIQSCMPICNLQMPVEAQLSEVLFSDYYDIIKLSL